MIKKYEGLFWTVEMVIVFGLSLFIADMLVYKLSSMILKVGHTSCQFSQSFILLSRKDVYRRRN